MRKWEKPIVAQMNCEDLQKNIVARAWSVGSAMTVGEFLDSANQGSRGLVELDFNPGHQIQVEVIGVFVIAGFVIKEILTETGLDLKYQQLYPGNWILYED